MAIDYFQNKTIHCLLIFAQVWSFQHEGRIWEWGGGGVGGGGTKNVD